LFIYLCPIFNYFTYANFSQAKHKLINKQIYGLAQRDLKKRGI